MANSLVSFREEESRKITATSICNEIGIDLPTYLRICISRLISEGGIPFSMKIDEQNKTMQVLKRASQRAEENGTSNMTLEEINQEISEARKNY